MSENKEFKKGKDAELSNSAPEIIWKEFYKDKSPKERYYLLKEELDRLIAETNARRQKKRESMEKMEQEINFRLKMMDKEGIWYGPNVEDEERAIAERSAYYKAEKEFEIKKAGILAEMEEIVQANKLNKKSSDNKLQ